MAAAPRRRVRKKARCGPMEPRHSADSPEPSLVGSAQKLYSVPETPGGGMLPFNREPSLVGSVLQTFLALEDACRLDCLSSAWRGRIDWRACYLCRFGVPPSSVGVKVDDQLWKSLCIWEEFFRMVPGDRALGIKLGSPTSVFRCKDGQRFQGDGVREIMIQGLHHSVRLALSASFRDCPPHRLGQLYGWYPPALHVGVCEDNSMVRAMGVCCPNLGTLEVPGRPELKGIRVGITVNELLLNLNAQFEDITIIGSNYGGTLFTLEEHAPGVCFQLDAWNGGRVEIDDPAICFDEPEALRARLDFTIGMIVVS